MTEPPTMPSLIGHFSASAIAVPEHIRAGLVDAVVGTELFRAGVHVCQVEPGARMSLFLKIANRKSMTLDPYINSVCLAKKGGEE